MFGKLLPLRYRSWRAHKGTPVMDNLNTIRSFSPDQLDFLDDQVKRARKESYDQVWDVANSWTNVLNRSGKIVGIFGAGLLIGGILLAGLSLIFHPLEPVPRLTDPAGQWVLMGTNIDGEDVYVKDPLPGVRCLRIKDNDRFGASGCFQFDPSKESVR